MSQDRSNSPPPPRTKQSPSVLKVQSVKLLRGIIRLSENAIARIETPQSAGTSTTFAKVQQFWSELLAPVRSLLPFNLSAKLSDLGLTGIIAGLLVVVLWITTLFSSPQPQVATIPSEPQPTITIPSEPEQTITTPEPEQTIIIPDPEPTITTPPELIAPIEDEPIEVTPLPDEEAEPTPTLKVELTPEQSLIASIQEQITKVSDRISDGLIQSIKANFVGGSLVIQLKNDWYSLEQSEQDNLAQKMLDEAQQLDFTHLEITDSQGTLLARSPVVGKNMIVFKRVANINLRSRLYTL